MAQSPTRPPEAGDDLPDDLKHSFYLQSFGLGLVRSCVTNPVSAESLPDRLAELLKELDDEREDDQ